MMSDESEYWVISDRVLIRNLAGEFSESSLALQVRGSRFGRIEHARALRGTELSESESRRGVPVFDVGPQPVVPSFVNAHTHLALSPLRGIAAPANTRGNVVTDVFFQIESHLTAEDVFVFTKMGAYESLLAGVGEVWDHYYFGESVADALVEVGLAGVVAPTLQDDSGPGHGAWEAQLQTTEQIAASERYRRVGIRAAVGPHASDTVSPALFQRAAELARRLSIPVHFHFLQSIEERRAAEVRFPRGASIELSELFSGVRVLMAHGLYLSQSDIARLVEAQWILAYCPLSQLQFGHLGPLASWCIQGGGWALGTDCVASNDALSPARELPLLFSDAALRTSFSLERTSLLAQGDLRTAEKLEEVRRRNLAQSPTGRIESILSGALGAAVESWSSPASVGFREGALANFLVLSDEHPVLFPGTDLARTVALGDINSAVDWAVTCGRRRGQVEGYRRSILTDLAYLDTLEEARRRKDELFVRAGLT
jgi:5-methylthioadenosine/S-adenosylhomocysteine deaminase